MTQNYFGLVLTYSLFCQLFSFSPLHQIYSAKMEIHAQLSGLRHIMWAKITIFVLIVDYKHVRQI